jgi:hypothetical protein
LRIAEAILIKVKQVQAQPILHFALAQVVQVRPPVAIFGQILGHVLRQKNVPGITAIHHSLRYIDSRSGDVCPVIDISSSTDGPAMNAHPDLDLRMISQGSANLQRTSHRFFWTVEKEKRHAIAGRHPDEFVPRFCSVKRFGAPHDLLQPLQQFDLLVHEQF